jgi:hypothetical protein
MSSRLLKSMCCTNDKALLDGIPIVPEEPVWREGPEGLSIEIGSAAAFWVTKSGYAVKLKTLKRPLPYKALSRPSRQTGIAGVPSWLLGSGPGPDDAGRYPRRQLVCQIPITRSS